MHFLAHARAHPETLSCILLIRGDRKRDRSGRSPPLHGSSVIPDADGPARQAIATRLSIPSPQDAQALLAEAEFSNVSLFYAGFSFKGWVGCAA